MHRQQQSLRYFDHRHVRYVWTNQEQAFKRLRGLDGVLTCAQVHNDWSRGLAVTEHAQRERMYGENSIHIRVKSYFRLLIEEVLNPFYIFQLCSIVLWSVDDYYIYASCILLISIISLSIELYETRKQRKTLRDMVGSTIAQVTVIRGGQEVAVDATSLVPGDLVIIPQFGCDMTVDAVLLSGNAIVNESMLTGESVPVTKTPLSPTEAGEVFTYESHKHHILFCGTRVIQTRYYTESKVKAVVIRTGFSTSKGELVSSILYPKPIGFKFYQDSIRFILILGVLAMVGMTYSVVLFIHNKTSIGKIVLRVLDIITIIVPPALPAAMTVGTVYAQSRLKKQGIFCISPPRINICGKIKLVCFDKTGTLTEDGLDMWGIVPLKNNRFSPVCHTADKLPERGPEIVAMATCHSLTKIDGEICGDPLDLKMFEATEWCLEEAGGGSGRFGSLMPTVVRPPGPRAASPSGSLAASLSGPLAPSPPGPLAATSRSGPRADSPSGPRAAGLSGPQAASPPQPGPLATIPPPPGPLATIPPQPGPLATSLPQPGPRATEGSHASAISLQLQVEAAMKILDEPTKNTKLFETLVPTVTRPVSRDSYISQNQSETPYEVGVVRQFPFSSSLQRMTVITRVLGAANMECYTKGAPEKIAALCRPETVPPDFHDVLKLYTQQGFRVIALAWRPLDSSISWHHSQKIERSAIEDDLLFLGLLVLENMLKPQTTPVISTLTAAHIRTVMVTGDNMLTAVSVARQCGMIRPNEDVVMVNAQPPEKDKPAQVEWELTDNKNAAIEPDLRHVPEIVPDTRDTRNTMTSLYSPINIEEPSLGIYHFAISGKSFAILRNHFPDLIPKIVVRGTVFARMSPDQKTQLVESLQELGYCVGMCGDGANDCGALKSAHAGISLSEAEASVASPFTSRTATIECVPTVIREGRAALVTSFGVFKYMALYSIVQFVSVLILYTSSTNLSDWMFLYIDLVITTTVAILMGHTGAYRDLVMRRPPGSLMAPTILVSLLLHVSLVILGQAGAILYLAAQPWYIPLSPNPAAEAVPSYEGNVVFLVSAFQYLLLAFVFSKGPPYRKHMWTNVPFLLALMALTGCTILLLLHPFTFFIQLFLMKPFPAVSLTFQLTLLGLVSIHFLLAVLIEGFVADSSMLKRLANWIRRKRLAKNAYKGVLQEMEVTPGWPPIGETLTSAFSPFQKDNDDSPR